MKKLLKNYEANKAILEENGISAIYYNNKCDFLVELEGGEIQSEYGIDNEELLEDIKSRIAEDGGEEMTSEEVENLKEFINFDFDFSTKKDLFETYKEWRKVSEEMLEDGHKGSLDCGEGSVREDFSAYAELEDEISFEEMFELEKRYEANEYNGKKK